MEHLAHAGAAGRALVADHDDVAGLDRARLHGGEARPPRSRRRAPGRGGTSRSCPASFTTQPSGARLPLRIARPPVGFSGCSSGTTTSWPGVSSTAAGDLGERAPVDGARRRAAVARSSSSRATQRDAAGLGMSVATKRPPGFRSRGSACAPRSRRSRRSCSGTPARARSRAGAGRRSSSRRVAATPRSRSRALRA